jgi:hypothetical protein
MPSHRLGPNRTHGRIATYNVGCRCEECRRVSRDRRARQRLQRRTRQYFIDWVVQYRRGPG